MKMKAVLVSLLVTALGGGLLLVFMQRYRAEASGGAPVPVLIVIQDLPAGEALTSDVLAVRTLPESYVEARHVRSIDSTRVVGLRTSQALSANQSLLWTDVVTGDDRAVDLSGLVRNGLRAVTVAVDAASVFEGLLQAGDRVDVLHHVERPGGGEPVTVNLLQNMLVLAVGGSTGRVDGGNCPTRSSSSVTLSATVEQAQLLSHASRRGEIGIVLRNPDDLAVMDGLPETSDADIVEPARRRRLQLREGTAPTLTAAVEGALTAPRIEHVR